MLEGAVDRAAVAAGDGGQQEVGLAGDHLPAPPLELAGSRARSARTACPAGPGVGLVRERRRRGGDGQGVAVVAVLDLHHLRHQRGRGQGVAEAQAGQRVALAEGAADDDVGAVAPAGPGSRRRRSRRRPRRPAPPRRSCAASSPHRRRAAPACPRGRWGWRRRWPARRAGQQRLRRAGASPAPRAPATRTGVADLGQHRVERIGGIGPGDDLARGRRRCAPRWPGSRRCRCRR